MFHFLMRHLGSTALKIVLDIERKLRFFTLFEKKTFIYNTETNHIKIKIPIQNFDKYTYIFAYIFYIHSHIHKYKNREYNSYIHH